MIVIGVGRQALEVDDFRLDGDLLAEELDLSTPSSKRITPDCPYFPRCGGCTYRHIRYEEELRLKSSACRTICPASAAVM